MQWVSPSGEIGEAGPSDCSFFPSPAGFTGIPSLHSSSARPPAPRCGSLFLMWMHAWRSALGVMQGSAGPAVQRSCVIAWIGLQAGNDRPPVPGGFRSRIHPSEAPQGRCDRPLRSSPSAAAIGGWRDPATAWETGKEVGMALPTCERSELQPQAEGPDRGTKSLAA